MVRSLFSRFCLKVLVLCWIQEQVWFCTLSLLFLVVRCRVTLPSFLDLNWKPETRPFNWTLHVLLFLEGSLNYFTNGCLDYVSLVIFSWNAFYWAVGASARNHISYLLYIPCFHLSNNFHKFPLLFLYILLLSFIYMLACLQFLWILHSLLNVVYMTYIYRTCMSNMYVHVILIYQELFMYKNYVPIY